MASAVLKNLHAQPPPGMRSYIVMFRTWRSEEGTRYDQTVSQFKQVEENRQKLIEFIAQRGLEPLVSEVAPGTAFGAVGVVMTPDAAKAVEELESVEHVILTR
mgnify:CR=1 FL=1